MPEKIRVWIEDAPDAMKALGFVKCAKQDNEPCGSPASDNTSKIIALFSTYEDAQSFRADKVATPESRLQGAQNVLRADYFQDVRDAASSIQDELMSRVKDGECGDELREWLIEHIHETIDGSSRIIYTQSAIECVLYSDNDGAYFEDFGCEGAVEDGSINWSRIAYSAFEKDVQEQLEALGVDLNAPVPNCDKCDSDDQDQSRKQVDGHDGLLCEDCVTEIEDEADESEDEADESGSDDKGDE